MWGGNNKIDALFNDRNHTYSVEAMDWSSPSQTNIQVINNPTSSHYHIVSTDGSHSHNVAISGIPDHTHTVTEDPVGNGAPIIYSPPFLGVVTYIRS